MVLFAVLFCCCYCSSSGLGWLAGSLMLRVAAAGAFCCGLWQFVCSCCLADLFCWLVMGAWLLVFSVYDSCCGALVLGAWCLVLRGFFWCPLWCCVLGFCSLVFLQWFLVSGLVVVLLCLSCFHSLLLFPCSSP